MHFKAARVLLAVALLSVSGAALAAPGTPIGGIIVKGGKNPGGQMRTLATTDADGKFRIRLPEGGDYKLRFDASPGKQSAARQKIALEVDGAQVEYVFEASDKIVADPGHAAGNASRHTPFHNRLENGQMIVSIPKGGGEIRGVLQADSAAERAINESGVSVSPTKPKGGVKK